MLFSSIAFASNFEINFGLSSGYSIVFDDVKQAGYVGLGYQYGMKIGDGTTLNAFISMGRNYKITNEKLTSISALFETGYDLYIKYRTYDITRNRSTEYVDNGLFYIFFSNIYFIFFVHIIS